MNPKLATLAGAVGLAIITVPANADTNRVQITERGNQICIKSNGVPNHAVGQFPNRGNPHTMRAQNINVCVNANPKKRNRFSGTGPGAIGIALNGVLIRPGTADYWDPRSRRGHSRNRSSGWNLEGMGAADMLGMDRANAHVDKRGIYHYHGPPNSALKTRAEPRSGGQRTALRSTILVPAQNPVIASRAARVRPGPVAGMTEPTSKTGSMSAAQGPSTSATAACSTASSSISRRIPIRTIRGACGAGRVAVSGACSPLGDAG